MLCSLNCQIWMKTTTNSFDAKAGFRTHQILKTVPSLERYNDSRLPGGFVVPVILKTFDP
jgi:hypothetical protein